MPAAVSESHIAADSSDPRSASAPYSPAYRGAPRRSRLLTAADYLVPLLRRRRDRGSDRRDTGRRRGPGTLLVAVLVGALVLVAGRGLDLLPGFPNPFEKKTIDRSTPPLLIQLQGLKEFRGGVGTFQEHVSYEVDVNNLPDWVAGQSVDFLGLGTVDAITDFSAVKDSAVQVSADRRSVVLTLPEPQLRPARIDPARSKILNSKAGLADRIRRVFAENPSKERELYVLAQQKIDAVAAQSDLLNLARTNTRAMLETLLRSLGFETIDIRFGDAADAAR